MYSCSNAAVDKQVITGGTIGFVQPSSTVFKLAGNNWFLLVGSFQCETRTRSLEGRLKGLKNLAPAGTLVVFVTFLMFSSAAANASDLYIAQNAAGAINGADCADAYAVAWFNTPANWGSNSGQIAPATTVHLCGIHNAPAGASGYLTFHGSGVSGDYITLLFEAGAVLEAPYWTGGAINLGGQSYLTINGGTNGLCEATQNGTLLTYQQDGGGCVVSNSNVSNVIVENLTISNIYVRNCGGVACSDSSGGNTYGIQIWAGTRLF